MGNANVSGLEEENNGEPEAGNKPIEAPITDSENDIIAEKQAVSLPSDENSHEDADLSGLNNLREDEEMLAKIDSDDSEEQASDGFLNDLLISKGSNDKDKDPLSTRKEEATDETVVPSDTTPAATGGYIVKDQKDKETADTEIQLALNGTNEEGAMSVISSEDGSYHEMESDSDKSLPETSADKIQKSTRTEGEELTSARLPLLKSEFIAFNNQDSDQLNPGNNNNEPHVGVVQRSNSDNQVLSKFDHCDDTGKELEKENETEHMLDGNAGASCIEKSEVEDLGDRMQVEVENFQKDKLLKMNKIADLRLEFKAGDGVGKTLDNEDVENGEEQRFMTPDFDKKDPTGSHLEVVPVSKSLEPLQKENSQAEDKFIVPTNDADLFNGPILEQKRNILSPISASQESQEKSKVGRMENSNPEYNGMGVVPEADNKATAPSDVNKYTLRTDLQTTEEKAIGVGHHVAFRDINTSSVRKEDVYSDQEPETRDENSGPPIELWVVDTNSEDVKLPNCSLALLGSNVEELLPEKGELQDYLEKDDEEVALKAVSFDLDPTKPDTSIPLPSVESQSQDPKPILPAMAIGTLENWKNTNLKLAQESYEEVDVGKTSNLHAEVSREEASMKRKTCSISTDQSKGQEHVYQSDHTIGNDSKMNLGSPDSNESYTTAYEQEHLIPNADAGAESSFRVDDQIAQTLFVEMLADFNQHAELSKEGEAEFSKQTSQKYEEKTISSEMFKASGSELYARKVGVSVASPVSETTVLAPQEDKEIPSEKLSQEQISKEKQVATLGRTNSAKLDIHIPLLSFLKDETYYMGSQHRQETLVAKKTTEDKWNTHEKKISGIARQRGAKRKPKPLFFNICMCCTPDIP